MPSKSSTEGTTLGLCLRLWDLLLSLPVPINNLCKVVFYRTHFNGDILANDNPQFFTCLLHIGSADGALRVDIADLQCPNLSLHL